VKIFFLEMGHIGYQKIENFMLISKKKTCFSDKMPPKKVKIKKQNKIGLSKIRKQFFNFNFFGGFRGPLNRESFLEIFLFVSVCFDKIMFVSVVSILVLNTETNRKKVFCFVKQTEKQPKPD
jgi:hypothetical protein